MAKTPGPSGPTLPLFPDSAPYQSHSSTSRAAAAAVKPDAASLRGQVLDYVRKHGPVTDEEMQDGLPMNPSTQRPRRIELHRAGLITQHPIEGVTRSGRKATRWVVTPAGEA